jgi:Ice-binding-like
MSNPIWPRHARRAGIVLAAGFAFAAAPVAAQASAVNLATAAPFVVLGGSTVTNTGPSVLNGDLGVAPGTALVGFGLPAVVNGATHDNDGVAGQAQSDLTTAYDVAAAQPITSDLTGQDLGGLTLTAGAYHYSTSAQLTGQLTLDAAGDPNAQFVFEIGSTLTTASASSVLLINGASPCNVYWQVGSSATLGTTTAFEGNVMALTSITLNHAATVQGRALARNGAVTLDDNALDGSMCGTSTTPPPGTTTPGTPPTSGTPGSTSGTPGSTSGTPGSTSGGRLPPASQTTVPTRKGTATLSTGARTAASPGSSCTSGFTATVRGHLIKRVVFTMGAKQIATRSRPLFRVHVRPVAGMRGVIHARVTFKDATRARTLAFAYRACAAAVLHPARGLSPFTG